MFIETIQNEEDRDMLINTVNTLDIVNCKYRVKIEVVSEKVPEREIVKFPGITQPSLKNVTIR
jgi:hypothetical protein